jgi:DNA-binding CsgD family transcriptional regulator
MSDFSSTDVKRFNQATLHLHTAQSKEDFALRIHEALEQILAGDLFVVDWVNLLTNTSLECRCFPDVLSDELNAIGHVLLERQSPNWMRCFKGAMSLSEHLSRPRWHDTALYYDGFRHLGQEDNLTLDIRLSPTLALSLACARSRRGFRHRERLLLNHLGPHVRQVHRRLAISPRSSLETWTATLARDGSLSQWPPAARRALARHGIRVRRDKPPEEIRSWLLEQRQSLENTSALSPGTRSLRLESARTVLRLYLMRAPNESGSYLIVAQERPRSPEPVSLASASRREREVLHWVAQGKTNAEIASILGVSFGTVKRHLENAYPKLGVENRHAAALLILQGEASALAP